MKRFARLLIAAAIFSIFSWVGCAQLPFTTVVFEIPSRPVACDLKGPEIQGKIQGDTVVLPRASAEALREYIFDLKECVIIRDGHIEKLENRLRALGGK